MILAKLLASGKVDNFNRFTWITGGSESEDKSFYPSWFSTGYFQSVPCDNLPDRRTDYYALSEFVTGYDRFIEVDAYIQGWIRAEIIGEYEGEYFSRNESTDGYLDTKHRNSLYKFYSDNIYYVYLNGNFKGKIQNGWVGSESVNPSRIDLMLKVVGQFNGESYLSCEKPHYVSGNINSLISTNNRDKFVLDFSFYDTNVVYKSQKTFDSVNLIRVPDIIEDELYIKPQFKGQYKIRPVGYQNIINYERGEYESINTFKTIENYIQPKIWEIKAEYDISIHTNGAIKVIPFAMRDNYSLSTSTIDLQIEKTKYKLFCKKIQNSYIPHEIKILCAGDNLNHNIVYNEGNHIDVYSEDTIKFYEQIIDNHSYTILNDISLLLESSKYEYCFVRHGLPNGDFISLVVLSDYSELISHLNTTNFLNNTTESQRKKVTTFSETPAQIGGVNQLVKDIEVIRGGSGYTGEESVKLDGERPYMWKSNWPITDIKVSDIFILNDKGTIVDINYHHFLLTGVYWDSDETITFQSEPSLIIDPSSSGSEDTASCRCITGEPTPSVDINVNIKNLNDLKLGYQIGNTLDLETADTFFEAKETLKYEIGLLQNKELKIKTKELESKIQTKRCT